jgi:hypothetical protein
VLLVILGLPAALAILVFKALAVDQVRGQIERRIRASVDATIASLPSGLAAEWEEEWRADLAETISMPVTAARYAWGLRQSARQLRSDAALARAGTVEQPQQRRREMKSILPLRRLTAEWVGGLGRWCRRNAAGVIALLLALTVSCLAVLEVLGADQINVAILLAATNTAEGVVATIIALTVAVLCFLEVLGTDKANSAMLLVLALLVVASLRDRLLEDRQ